MRLLICTDAWEPQVNGVVRTLREVRRECQRLGHEVVIIRPDQFVSLPCPTYPEIRLALRPASRLERLFDRIRPDSIHIATEGPIGFASRMLCLRRGLAFTTSYHTCFPEYLAARLPLSPAIGYALIRWFHRPSLGVMVATASIRRRLAANGVGRLRDWTRGVDTAMFRPDHRRLVISLPRPLHLYVGRVAVEKNIEAFLNLPLKRGSKLVVGDGPARARLCAAFPDAHFFGARHGLELAQFYASADVLVFPSRTDTFGLVMLEALASGLPVAAFPVPGPKDVLEEGLCGAMDDDLGTAVERALSLSRTACRAYAKRFSWTACARQFLANLAPAQAGLGADRHSPPDDPRTFSSVKV